MELKGDEESRIEGGEQQETHTPSQTPSNEYVLNVAFFSFVGFLLVQLVFALIANSQSMLADSEAMSVDSITYLFNLCAERIKNRPMSEAELRMPEAVRSYNRELQRLYLEVVPPTISVLTLMVVTVITFREARRTLRGEAEGDEEDVSVTIMLLFSSCNLLLDIVNVTCFARANLNFGLDVVRREQISIQKTLEEAWDSDSDEGLVNERAGLVDRAGTGSFDVSPPSLDRISSSTLTPRRPHAIVNLNMCSAWTHVCADTLRSSAVLLAAAIAFVFPGVDGGVADAVAAIAVSLIIFGSLFPLVQGLCLTALEIHSLTRHPPTEARAT